MHVCCAYNNFDENSYNNMLLPSCKLVGLKYIFDHQGCLSYQGQPLGRTQVMVAGCYNILDGVDLFVTFKVCLF